MGKEKKIRKTKIDKEILESLPDGWFKPDVLWFVQNACHRCERLEALGLLKSRAVGNFPDFTMEYQKVEAAA